MGRKKFRVRLGIAVFIAFLVLGNTSQVYAAAECNLLQILIEGKGIVSYVECGSGIQSADAQAAQYPCENVEIVAPENISVHTVIMLDNSLSISETNRENIKNIMRQYVQGVSENEAVSLAVFGEEMEFLTEKSQDTDEMIRLIDEIEFYNQDTYLTDYLYQAIEKIENDPEYTRFIVISDGVDNNAIGITKDELISKLKETSRPIDTIGHIYKDNSSELKNMFALSRATGGEEVLIEDFEEMSSIVEKIHDLSHIYSIKMDVPQNVMDGGNRRILINLHTEEGDVEVTGEAAMPFTRMEPESEPEPEPKQEPASVSIPAPAPEPEQEPESEPDSELKQESKPESDPEPERKPAGIGIEKIAGAVILLIAAAALILYRKKNKSDNGKESKRNTPVVPEAIPEAKPAEDATVILDGRYLLVLRDRSNPERIFRYPMDGHVIVGRNIDMVQIAVDYSLTVSGQHCEFYIKNNRFFIRDMNSINHTYLDGRMISGECEIMSGNVVRLGEVEFGVEIMPI